MTNPKTKLTREELIKLLPTTGWDLVTGSQAFPVKNRTLEELVRASHARHIKGEAPGLIARIENALEIDMVELQELWLHLGLPT